MPRCLKCKQKFVKKYPNQMGKFRFCMEKTECIKAFNEAKNKHLAEQRAKAWRKEKKVLKDKIKSHSQWLNELQVIFNRYIRLRDKGKECISCGKPDIGKRDASHYFSVGSTPNLRFNEDNVHASCVQCNRDLHGNIAEYTIRLPNRIGKQRFEKLQQDRNGMLKLSIPEIKDLIKKYKEKIKKLK